MRATLEDIERDGVKIVCRWDRPLTEDDHDKLLATDGDCRAAGIPCEKHRERKYPVLEAALNRCLREPYDES